MYRVVSNCKEGNTYLLYDEQTVTSLDAALEWIRAALKLPIVTDVGIQKIEPDYNTVIAINYDASLK